MPNHACPSSTLPLSRPPLSPPSNHSCPSSTLPPSRPPVSPPSNLSCPSSTLPPSRPSLLLHRRPPDGTAMPTPVPLRPLRLPLAATGDHALAGCHDRRTERPCPCFSCSYVRTAGTHDRPTGLPCPRRFRCACAILLAAGPPSALHTTSPRAAPRAFAATFVSSEQPLVPVINLPLSRPPLSPPSNHSCPSSTYRFRGHLCRRRATTRVRRQLYRFRGHLCLRRATTCARRQLYRRRGLLSSYTDDHPTGLQCPLRCHF